MNEPTNSLDTIRVEIEGPSDPNPGPLPESARRAVEELRELLRQAGQLDEPPREQPAVDPN